MPLLNYTTTISAAKTVGEIQGILAEHGAKSILIEYDDSNQVEALSFQVKTPAGLVPIRLPVDWQAVQKVLIRQGVAYKYQEKAHCLMVAWRILKDWTNAQMAILETEMVKMEQIFLPYIVTPNGQTVYQALSEHGFLALPEGRADEA